MELRAYLRILLDRWWIVLLTFVVTYATTLGLTFLQPPRYDSKATFLIGLSEVAGDPRDFASSLDILNRRPEIGTTFSLIADSALVKNLAADELGVSSEQRNDIAVSSRLVPGSAILEITSNAGDAALTQSFTNAVGKHTIDLMRAQFPIYNLSPVDQARLPGAPSSPNTKLNLGLGAVVGLALGVGLAFLAAYLQAPSEMVSGLNIRDEETGIYNKRYFVSRLRQELSRAKRNSYPLSIGLLNLNPRGELDDVAPAQRREVIRKVAVQMQPYLRDEDVLARFGDTMCAFLLPDMIGTRAKEAIEDLQMLVAATPVEFSRDGVRLNIDASAGVAAYHGTVAERDMEADDLVAQAMRALKQAEIATYSKVLLLPNTGEQQDSADHPPKGQTVPLRSQN